MAEEVTLPTEEEIRQLPRWARVAFAARCARRVLPLFKHFWPAAPGEHVKVVDTAVRVAEYAAATAALSTLCRDSVTFAAATAVTAATHPRAAAAAAAAAAAGAAIDCRGACGAAAHAGYAARGTQAANHLRADFKYLLKMAKAENWTDDTPVPPTVFGPMWPDGPPRGWPKDEALPTPEVEEGPVVVDEGKRLVLRVEVPEIYSPEQAREIEDGINELINALNEVHIARGAGRLTLDDIKHLIPALVKEGV